MLPLLLLYIYYKCSREYVGGSHAHIRAVLDDAVRFAMHNSTGRTHKPQEPVGKLCQGFRQGNHVRCHTVNRFVRTYGCSGPRRRGAGAVAQYMTVTWSSDLSGPHTLGTFVYSCCRDLISRVLN